jgi:hypothetical protein
MTSPVTGPPVRDGYDERYAAKLWSLVPALYRAADSTSLDQDGPLRELLDRIGPSMAVVRRSIDRLWDDQSIETCDAWVIPYLADLLATNLVPSMDVRGQRLDVANTIYYRRRKGTVPLLEQLAHDVTGYEVRVVEFFRRLARTRHNLDPAIGRPADAPDPAAALTFQRTERLTGLLTGTPAGGWADLRERLGASSDGSPYDEFAHHADVRLGQGRLGWYGIGKLGFFLYRSVTFPVDRATPVAVAGCPGHFGFDSTGRQLPLFTAAARGPNDYGESWTPIGVWQVPQPLTQGLWEAIAATQATPPNAPLPPEAYPDRDAALWPGSLSVSPTGSGDPLEVGSVAVWPEVGRFRLPPSAAGPIEVGYTHALFSRIGAGPYDRLADATGVEEPVDYPAPEHTVDVGTASDLPAAIAAAGARGTITIRDGLTSTVVAPVGSPAAPIDAVAVRAADSKRAVIRLEPATGPWRFTGGTASTSSSSLRLEGVLFSGGDLVLDGDFDQVVLFCCTIDPGNSGDDRTPATIYGRSVDDRDLAPTTIWVEGSVRSFVVDRCLTGPIRTRAGGLVENLCVTNSVVQGLASEAPAQVTALRDADSLLTVLNEALPDPNDDTPDELTAWLAAQLSPASAAVVTNHTPHTVPDPSTLGPLVADLQAIVDGPLIYAPSPFADRPLTDSTAAAVLAPPTGPALAVLNRRLLAEAFPSALADGALVLDGGVTCLSRVTLLGPAWVHRLECSESLLDDVVRVRDAQDGCVRFTAWSTDSALPRRYESVRIAPRSPVMLSRRYGEWGYAQLQDDADTAVLDANTGGPPSLLTGSHDGLEVGAFCRDGAAIKDRSLLVKLREYQPIGLSPVLVHLPVADPEGEYLRGRPWPPT